MDIKRSTYFSTTVRRVIVFLVIALLSGLFAIYFQSQVQRAGWKIGWIYVGMVAAATIINLVCMGLWNPDLIERRMRMGKWQKTWDKVWIVLFSLAMIAMFVVAGIDVHGRIGSNLGASWLFGYAIFVIGWTLLIWSMVVNPFFEKSVRIQTEHEHRVIDAGPYAVVRHPGYVGLNCWLISTPQLLLSGWALLPSLAAVVLTVIRTALEDRTLRDELSGYKEYMKRVRFRLIPGIW